MFRNSFFFRKIEKKLQAGLVTKLNPLSVRQDSNHSDILTKQFEEARRKNDPVIATMDKEIEFLRTKEIKKATIDAKEMKVLEEEIRIMRNGTSY